MEMGFLDFLNNLPTGNELTGSLGEWLAKQYSKSFPGALVLHDVLIDGAQQHTSQIDLVIIGGKGIYVVEMKMYTDAKVYGDTSRSKWYYYNHGTKYEIYSPLKQNQKHVQYLKAFLKDFGEVPCFNIVTMVCDDFKVSGGFEGNTVLCNSLPAMKRAILHIAQNNPEIWDEAKKQEIYHYIVQHQHTGKAARLEHKENVVAYKSSLEDLNQRKICPYCKSALVLRKGKYGEFYGCSNYPKCKYTMK
jgi:transposase-like protein